MGKKDTHNVRFIYFRLSDIKFLPEILQGGSHKALFTCWSILLLNIGRGNRSNANDTLGFVDNIHKFVGTSISGSVLGAPVGCVGSA